jgi:hypothetical protein
MAYLDFNQESFLEEAVQIGRFTKTFTYDDLLNMAYSDYLKTVDIIVSLIKKEKTNA